MKLTFGKTLFAITLLAFFTSCSKSSDSISEKEATSKADTYGEVNLTFNNKVDGKNLVFNKPYTNSNGETVKIDRFNYLINNIVLIKEDGSKYAYSGKQEFFIISEGENSNVINLKNIPVGKYVKVQFDLGINKKEASGEPHDKSSSIWDYARNFHMTCPHSGYRFINFEGYFTSPSVSSPARFEIHQKNNKRFNNYVEIKLSLNTPLQVTEKATSGVTVIADASVILNGKNNIVLSENINKKGTRTAIFGNKRIAENSETMFSISSVNN